ncbi:MAG: aminotransferase class III-fold pyridoxal phosphate-dependent enzyme [Chloroflexota bacterium]|nr:aminotransferase class III-fold pyridoxal phosphate-dependent enzyme [Chloroflexota bacterium]
MGLRSGAIRSPAPPRWRTWTSCWRKTYRAGAKEIGNYPRSQLQAAFADHPNVGDIRGAGLFLGVELVKDRSTKATFDDSGLLAWLTDRMREQGLILRNDDRGDPTTQLCPPLVITHEECDRTVEILAASFDELGKKLGTVGTVHATG